MLERKLNDPVERLTLSYKNLFLQLPSNDEEADEALRRGLQSSFREHDTLLSEVWTPEGYRNLFVYGLELGVEQLQDYKVTTTQRDQLNEQLDDFIYRYGMVVVDDVEFFQDMFSRYEERYKGETVDYEADYARYLRDFGDKDLDSFLDSLDDDDLYLYHDEVVDHEIFEEESTNKTKDYAENKNEFTGSGLTYAKPSLDVEQAKSKQQVRQYETKQERNFRISHDSQQNRQHDSHTDGHKINAEKVENINVELKTKTPKTKTKKAEGVGLELG